MREFFKKQKFTKALSVTMSVLMASALFFTALPQNTKDVLAVEADVAVKSASEAAETADVVVKLATDATEVKAGDTLTATLSVEKNAGLAALVARFKYDTDVLSLVSVESAAGSGFKDAVLFPVAELLKDKTQTIDVAADGIVGFAYAGTAKTEATGAVLTAKFNVKAEATVGEHTLSFTYLDASDEKAADKKVQGVAAAYKVAATIDVQPDENNTEENQAAKEVAKLVEQLFKEDSEVKGIDEKLADIIKEAVSAYKEVIVEVQKDEVKESELPKEEAALVKEKLTEERQLAACYDIDMVVTIDGKEKGTITEIANPITVSVKIPENLPALEEGYVRIYFILRVHDGKVEELPATVSGENVTFRTDKFSTYVLGYEDSKGIKGDINGDGEVNIADALVISRYDAQLVELDESVLALGDVNGDGEVNIADALVISRYDARLIDSF